MQRSSGHRLWVPAMPRNAPHRPALPRIAAHCPHCATLPVSPYNAAHCPPMSCNAHPFVAAGTHKRCPYDHGFAMEALLAMPAMLRLARIASPRPHWPALTRIACIASHCPATTIMAIIALVAGQWMAMRAPTSGALTIMALQWRHCFAMFALSQCLHRPASPRIALHCRASPRIATHRRASLRIAAHRSALRIHDRRCGHPQAVPLRSLADIGWRWAHCPQRPAMPCIAPHCPEGGRRSPAFWRVGVVRLRAGRGV